MPARCTQAVLHAYFNGTRVDLSGSGETLVAGDGPVDGARTHIQCNMQRAVENLQGATATRDSCVGYGVGGGASQTPGAAHTCASDCCVADLISTSSRDND